MTFDFHVDGVPRPAGSKRAVGTSRTGKTVLADMSGTKGKQWRRAVAQAGLVARAQAGVTEVTRRPVALEVQFCLPRPKTHSGTDGALTLSALALRHTIAPDATKLLRAVEDALTGVLWYDDAQVVEQFVRKRYANTEREVGAYVKVRVL